MRQLFPISLVILLFAQSLPAQNAARFRLGGRVADASTGDPLPGTSVIIVELQEGRSTTVDGRFVFNSVPEGTYRLIIHMVGYAHDTLSVVLDRDREIVIRVAEESVVLDEIRVTGNSDEELLMQSSQALSILSGKELDKHRGQTLGESIEGIPGVTLLQTGPSIAKPVIRGLHSQRVLVLNAGVQQEGQQWGAEHAPEIDPFSPTRIEVLKGPSGLEYGAGAIGGVVRVEPRGFRDAPGIGGEILLNAFTNNRQGSGTALFEGAHEELPGFAWRGQVSYRRAGDAMTPDYPMNNTGFEEFDVSPAVSYSSGNFSGRVHYSHFSTTLGIFRGSHIGNVTDLLNAIELGHPQNVTPFSYDITPPKQEIRHDLVSVLSSWHFLHAGTLELQLGYQQNDRKEFDAHKAYDDSIAALDNPSFELTLTTYTADLKFRHDPVGSAFGTVGVSGMRQGNIRSGDVYLIPNFRAYTAGVFWLESVNFDSWTLAAGVRYDYRWTEIYPFDVHGLQQEIRTYNYFSGSLSAQYAISSQWSIGTNAGTTSRPPWINELYSNDVHHGTAQFEIGDPTLTPERSVHMDVTLKHSGETVRMEFSAFHNAIDDFIYLYPDSQPTLTIRGAFPTFRYTGTDALLRGIEGSLDVRATKWLNLGLTASIVRGDNRDDNEPLISLPADRVRIVTHFHIDHVLGLHNAYAELGGTLVRTQDRVPDGFDYAPPPPGYGLLDIGGGGEFFIGSQVIAIDLAVQNVLNTQYRDYLSRYRYYTDDPGINFILRGRISIGDFDAH